MTPRVYAPFSLTRADSTFLHGRRSALTDGHVVRVLAPQLGLLEKSGTDRLGGPEIYHGRRSALLPAFVGLLISSNKSRILKRDGADRRKGRFGNKLNRCMHATPLALTAQKDGLALIIRKHRFTTYQLRFGTYLVTSISLISATVTS
jgi:hypothetical protein